MPKTVGKGKVVGQRILMAATAVFLVLSLVLGYVMNYFDYIMDAYIGRASISVESVSGTEDWDTDYYDTSITEDEAAANTRAVVQQIAEEGFVLEKNNGTLPLTETDKVSVFGWGFTHPVYGGTGSGSSDSSTSISPEQGLEDSGFAVNEKLNAEYEEWSKANNAESRPSDTSINTGDYWTLPEMPLTEDITDQAAEYSDTAIVWIARQGGEGQDEALNMDDALNGVTDVQKGYSESKHYLELTDAEESMIAAIEADDRIENIIVIINSSNPMELAELENDPNIDAVLLAGAGGCTGFEAIGEILRGTVSPSGRNTDTYYANFKLDPTYQNFGDPDLYSTDGPSVNYYGDDDLYEDSAEGGTYTYTAFVQYEEGIYMGYRYYETAYEMLEEASGDTAADSWYYGWQNTDSIEVGSVTDKEDTGVVYPFGYGLSYTTFDWEIVSSNMDADVDDTLTIEVKVTNTGDYAGKDVVELYYTAPYYDGGIEKASVVLGAFAKTDTIQPGESDTVTLELAVEDMASYDETHENPDGTVGCYVLDEGDYILSLRTDAHTVKSEDTVLTYTVGTTVEYDTEETKRDSDETLATNAFTENLAERSESMTDMSRSDWGYEAGEGTFPTQATEADQVMSDALKESLMNKTVGGVSMVTGETAMTGLFDPEAEGYINSEDEMPTTGADNGIQLINMRGLDYDDPAWDDFLDEFTVEEMESLICGGSYSSEGIDRLGVPAAADGDGPSSLKWQGSAGDVNGIVASTGSQALPSEQVMACTWNVDLIEQAGITSAAEGLIHGCSGWYAPGLDTHRSPFGGRNFEYFSEDPVLAGTLCAAEVSGAASQGVYCYVKHFVMNDQETFRNVDATGNWAELTRSYRFLGATDDVVICTWVSEQAIREIYCKAFELVVKNATYEMKYIADENGTVATKTMPACTGIMSGFCFIGDTWCGANSGLLQQLLRDEWGFQGSVLTDAAAYPYMSQDNFVFNSGDLLLAIGQNSLLDVTKNTASGVIQMRRAVKNQMFTKANSNVMNGIAPGSVIVTGIAPWQYLEYGIIAVAALLFLIVWGRFAYTKIRGRKNK